MAPARRKTSKQPAGLRGAGLSLSDAIRLTVYVIDLAEFPKLNEIFASVLSEPFPARATV